MDESQKLRFDDHGDYWIAISDRAAYTIVRGDDAKSWGVTAVLSDPTGNHAAGLEREYETRRSTIDGAMLACRIAERDGFDSWSSTGATPNTSADAGDEPRRWTAAEWAGFVGRCDGCGQPAMIGAAWCPRCDAERRVDSDKRDAATVAVHAAPLSQLQAPLFATAEAVYAAPLSAMVAWLRLAGVTACNGVYGCTVADLDGSAPWHWDAARDTVFDHAGLPSEDDDPTRPCSSCKRPLDTRGELARNLCIDCQEAPIDPRARVAVMDLDDGAITWTGPTVDYIAANPDDHDSVTRLQIGDTFTGGGGAQPWYMVVRLTDYRALARDAFGAPFDAAKE